METVSYRGLDFEIRAADRPYFEAASDGVLVFQRCGACGLIRYPTARLCPDCGGDRYEWQQSAGRGVVVTSLVVIHGVRAQFEPPYAYGLVELDDVPGNGQRRVRLLTDFVGADGETPLREGPPTGTPVRAVFSPLGDGLGLPRFAVAA